jgi:hypothetical protein
MVSGSGGGGGAPATGAGGSMGCDITPLIQGTGAPNGAPPKYYCIQAGACHDGSATTAAGMSMQKADWPKLVNGTPNGMNQSICGADPAYKTMPYIMKGSANGDGLLMKKLNAPTCSPMGAQMPTLGGPMTAADKMCFQQWATALANM